MVFPFENLLYLKTFTLSNCWLHLGFTYFDLILLLQRFLGKQKPVFDNYHSSYCFYANVNRSASSDGQLVVAGVESGDVVIWDLIKMNCVNSIKLSESMQPFLYFKFPVLSYAFCS